MTDDTKTSGKPGEGSPIAGENAGSATTSASTGAPVPIEARLRAALDTAAQFAGIMSNVCWSLGHKDREVGPREPLAKLAKDWDEFRSGIGDLLAQKAPSTERPK